MQEACISGDGILPAQARRHRAGQCADMLSMVLAGILALSLSGCSNKESVLYSGKAEKPARDAFEQDGHPPLENAAEYGLQCGYRMRRISEEEVWDGEAATPHMVPSGPLVDFQCANPNGVLIDLELASYQMNQGKIETKSFGTIRTQGSFLMPDHDPVQFYMTWDQIVRLREFLRHCSDLSVQGCVPTEMVH